MKTSRPSTLGFPRDTDHAARRGGRPAARAIPAALAALALLNATGAAAAAPTPAPATAPPAERGPAIAGTPAPAPRARVPEHDVSFSLVLVVASQEAARPGATGIPPGVARALADLENFLPYKGYEFLDAAWIRTSAHASTTVAAPGGGSFDVRLSIEPVEANPAQILVRNFLLREIPVAPQHAVETPNYKVTPLPSPPARDLLNTSLSIAMGETVVVGTSRLDATGKALIVLLTARP